MAARLLDTPEIVLIKSDLQVGCRKMVDVYN
jgi:hypothetical protein